MLRRIHYCPPGSVFYGQIPAGPPYRLVDVPHGWSVVDTPDNEWIVVLVDGGRDMPPQGWKIHISATVQNAQSVLETAAPLLIGRRVNFKYLRSSAWVARRNSKYGDRTASGKFMTIYPSSNRQFAELLTLLDAELAAFNGPYILSDLRWKAGPLYVRYGGFLPQLMHDEHGRVIHCITDPDGKLVPDERRPSFRPPAWVTIPDVLAPAIAARAAGTMADFPYSITKALHHTNAGGVYLGAADSSATAVLIREARPLAGIDAEGNDAVARLYREAHMLTKLADVRGVPRLTDVRRGHEHHFLVRDYQVGTALDKLVAARRDVLSPEAYVAWVLPVLDQVDAALQRFAERGVTFGDLHPGNIIVDDADRVSFIDFETATDTPDAQQVHAAVGYEVPKVLRGPAIDRYALGLLRLGVFVPDVLLNAVHWGTGKISAIVDAVTARFPLPPSYREAVMTELTVPGAVPTIELHPALRELSRGVVGLATPDDAVQLFRGDAEQYFTDGGAVAFAHGAAGVLWTWRTLGLAIPLSWRAWFVARARELPDGTPDGLFDGRAGIAVTLAELGEHELAERTLESVSATADHSLHSGSAGIGLARWALWQHTGTRAHLDAAMAILDALVAPLAAEPRGAGFLRGLGGPALLAARLAISTQADSYAQHAVTWLARDLERLSALAASTLALRGGDLLVADLLRRSGIVVPTTFTDALHAKSVVVPASGGLFHGVAGEMLIARQLGRDVEWPWTTFANLFAVHLDGHYAILGPDQYRGTVDFATGSAGVLLAYGERPVLPFLEPI